MTETAPAPPPSDASWKRLALRGSAWTVAGYGGGQLLRLGSNLILTRLLFPEAFGLMVLVSVILQGLEMFSDMGLRPSIIQSRRGDDPAFLNTAWTVQVLRGLALGVGACLLAWPAAHLVYTDKPELAALVPVAGLTPIIAGFQSTSLVTLNRHMAVGRIILLELGCQVVGLAVMVSWALSAPSVWALLGGGIAASLAKTVGSHVMLPGIRHRFHWDAAAWTELFRLGRWVFLSTAFTYLAGQSDRLILGGYLTGAMLGIASIAFLITESLATLMSHLGHRILLPTFSRLHREAADQVGRTYDAIRARVDPVVLAGVGLLVTAGSLIVEALWDDRYAEAGTMLEILVVRVALHYALPYAWAIQASRADLRYWVIGNVGRTLWLWIALPVAWNFGGLEAALWAVALSDVPTLAAAWVRMGHFGFFSMRREAVAATWFVVGAGAGTLLEGLASGVG